MTDTNTTPQDSYWKTIAATAMAILMAVLLAPLALAQGQAVALDGERFDAHVTALTATPHRRTGTDAGRAAADYLEAQLRGFGTGTVMTQPFASVQTYTERCQLTLPNGVTLALHPLAPNGLQASVTGPDGITGPVRYVGHATRSELAGHSLAGAIALVEYEAPNAVLELFRLGAAAVVFLGREGDRNRHDFGKRSYVSVQLPRFYVDGALAEQAGLLKAAQVTIHSQVQWRPCLGRNVYLWLAGTQPNFGDKDEFLILSAPYDSGGIVPDLNRAPEAAANCAALLETARVLAAQPPKRSVLIAFFDGHHNFLEGGRQFYTAFRRAIPARLADPHQRRLEFVGAEREHLTTLLSFFDGLDDLNAEHPSREQGLEMLAQVARFAYEDLQGPLIEQRHAIDELTRDGLDAEAPQAKLEELLVVQKQWQRVREAIRDRTPLATEYKPVLAGAVATVQQRLQRRLAELTQLETLIQADVALAEPFKDSVPVLHLSYRLSAANETWMYYGNSSIHARFYRSWRSASSSNTPHDAFLEHIAAAPKAHIGHITIEEAELADVFEIPTATLVTEQDAARRRGVPTARFERDELTRVLHQANDFLTELRQVGDGEWASVPSRMVAQSRVIMERYQWTDRNAVEAHMVKSFTYGQQSAERLEPGALVHAYSAKVPSSAPEHPIHELAFVTVADGNAAFSVETLLHSRRYFNVWRTLNIEAARTDEQGELTMISTCVPTGGLGSVQNGWDQASAYRSRAFSGHHVIVPMFSGTPGQLFGLRQASGEPFSRGKFKLMNGLSNTNYKRSHMRWDATRGIGVYYVDTPMGQKLIYPDTPFINNSDDLPTGIGYGAGNGLFTGPGIHRLDLQTAAANDLWILNESRLAKLRSKNIVLNTYEFLHSRSQSLRRQFAAAKEAHEHGRVRDLAQQVTRLEQRLYQPVISVTNDMVVAVTILLLLAIPFAFSIQNLVWPTYDVYRQIARFGVVFGFSFLLLYWVHPAFAFAQAPVIIILAFIILIMSALVIWIIADKFRQEVKVLQGQASAAHAFQQSAVGNFGAAMSLAIATMRRRPARTTLTVTTVLLLTFTILSFVSFQAEEGITRFPVGPGDNGTRVLVHRKVWKTMEPGVLGDIDGIVGEQFETCGRYWLIKELSTSDSTGDFVVPLRATGERRAEAGAVMSLDPVELARVPGIAKLLDGDVKRFEAGEGLFLSATLVKELGVEPGQQLQLRGETFELLGTFDSLALLEAKQIDGSPLLPVNFGLTQAALGGGGGTGRLNSAEDDLVDALAELEPDALEPINPEELVIVPSARAHDLGMALKAVLVFPNGDEDVLPVAEELSIINDFGAYVNQGGNCTYLHFGKQFGAVGFGDVLVPLLLGALIVFSTMLGSVIDREKEIYTFSALGLAPRTIASLFFVEAGIYAVIGGFGGYLLSQVVTRVLEWMTTYGLFKAPEINYSSSTAIYTILIVMVTVIVSTIYPAIQAAQRATADAASKWRVPAADGDRLRFEFPFTISEYDISGIMCFVMEHFNSYADRTVGRFAAGDVTLFKAPDSGMMALRARIWLAPFDQGISQEFYLTAHESDIEEVCGIHIEIERISGPPAAWQRSNVVFLDDLRTQFLLWRTLTDDVVDHYLDVADDEALRLGIEPPPAPA